jgi:type IV pilus assembly protein PilM
MRLLRGRPLAGLDIGSSAVKAVELTKSGSGYRVAGFASEPLSPGAVVDGAIVDVAAVADTVRRTFAGGKIGRRSVAAGISGGSVFVKRVMVPAATSEEVHDAIQFDAEQHIPFEIADVNLDYEIAGASATDGEGMEVVLAAAKKDGVQNLRNAITLGGRRAEVVDVGAFALQNAYEANYRPHPNETVALLDIGASSMNVNISKAGMPLFVRNVAAGGNQYTNTLQKELQLSFRQAEDLKLGKTPRPDEVEMVLPLLAPVTALLMAEVRKTFDLFQEAYPCENVSRIMISGGVSNMANLAGTVQEITGYPTEVLNPFRSISVSSRLDAARIVSLAPSLAVAVGLALRRFDS